MYLVPGTRSRWTCCVKREEGVSDEWDPGACVGGCSLVSWGSISVAMSGVLCDMMDAMDNITPIRDEDMDKATASSCCKGVGSRGTLDVEETENMMLESTTSKVLDFGVSCSDKALSPWTVIFVLIDLTGEYP